jgi:hypothetical protein
LFLEITAHQNQCQRQAPHRLDQRPGLFRLFRNRSRRQLRQQLESIVQSEFTHRGDLVAGKIQGHTDQAGSEEVGAVRATDLEGQGRLSLPGVVNDQQHAAQTKRRVNQRGSLGHRGVTGDGFG